jgi:GNAT superfamily N-acetyltransferase/heme-degrading monooxygenase HmoA
MIARIWHGRTPIAKANAYLAFLEERAIPDYTSIPGNRGAWVLRRDDGDEAHFLTLSLWDSMDVIEAFAGEDVAKAKYYPEDRDFLLDLEPKVTHYEVYPRESIRPATSADAAAIAALSGQLGYPSTEEEIRTRLEILEAGGSTSVLVAESDGRIDGWIAVRFDLSLETGAFAEIAGLVVDEAARGKGIGASLVEAAEEWAKERGHTRIRVRSNVVREAAHRFYERLGYLPKKKQQVFDKEIG